MFGFNDYIALKLAKEHYKELKRGSDHDRLVKTVIEAEKLENHSEDKHADIKQTER